MMLSPTSPEAVKMLNGTPSLRYRRRLKAGFLFLLLIILLGFFAAGSQMHPQLRKHLGDWSLLPGAAFFPHRQSKLWNGKNVVLDILISGF
jgi:hypothetical protein